MCEMCDKFKTCVACEYGGCEEHRAVEELAKPVNDSSVTAGTDRAVDAMKEVKNWFTDNYNDSTKVGIDPADDDGSNLDPNMYPNSDTTGGTTGGSQIRDNMFELLRDTIAAVPQKYWSRLGIGYTTMSGQSFPEACALHGADAPVSLGPQGEPLFRYSEDQPRDPNGEFASGGGSNDPGKVIEHLNSENPVNPENDKERLVVVDGKTVGKFEVTEREGRLRIKGISSDTGNGNLVLGRITDAADKEGVTLELTASPYGSHKLDSDALKSWYGRHGFTMEQGYDEALGYMIREPNNDRSLSEPTELRFSEDQPRDPDGKFAGGGDVYTLAGAKELVGKLGDGSEQRADDEGGEWITIHGAHVFIKDGVIEKGPEGFVGKTPQEIGSGGGTSTSQKDIAARPDFSGSMKVPGGTLTLSQNRTTKVAEVQAFAKSEMSKLPAGTQAALNSGMKTSDMYKTGDKYNADRVSSFHNPVIDKALAGKTPQGSPKVVFVGGGPAAGKTTASDDAARNMSDHVAINVDDIRTAAPEFTALLPDRLMPINEETGDIRDRLISEAGDARYNLIIDGVGSKSAAENVANLVGKGYTASYVYVHREVGDAQQRADDRPYMTSKIADMRILPQGMVEGFHDKARGAFSSMAKVSSEVKVIDKSRPEFGKEGKVVFWKDGSNIKVYDAEGVKRVENGGKTKIRIYP